MAQPPIYRDPLDGSEMIPVVKDGRRYLAPLAAVLDHAAKRQAPIDAAQAAEIAALKGRPEEVVHFTGSLTTGLLAIGTKVFTVSGIAGLLASDRVVVENATALPAGVSIAGARVVADGTVEVTLAAVLALTASRTIPLTITALR